MLLNEKARSKTACIQEAPLSMGFSRQKDWSGLPFPSPGGLPDPRIQPRSRALQADSLLAQPPGKPFFFFFKYLFYYVFGCTRS